MTLRRSLGAAVLAVLAMTAPAAAGTDPTLPAVCTQAERELKAKDLVQASISAGECDALDPVEGALLLAELEKKATAKGWSPVEIVTEPAGGQVVVSDAPDRPFAAPRLVWLAPGSHDITGLVDGQPVVRSTVRVRGGDRAVALLELPEPPPPAGPQQVDFGEEGGGGEVTHGPPPDQKFGSLLPDRYRRGIDAEGEDEVGAGRRGQPWRLAIGPAYAGGWGAMLGVQRAVAITRAVAIAPEVGVSVVRDEATVVRGHGAVTVQLGAALFGELRGRLGVGPGVTASADATSLGAVGLAELSRRRLALVLRVELPALSTVDDDVTTAALLLGTRW